jgi:hypothetical protein
VEVPHISLAPEGIRIITLSDLHLLLKVVDPETGQVVRTGKSWQYPLVEGSRASPKPRTWSGYSPDGSWFYQADRELRIHDPTTGNKTVIDAPELVQAGGPRFSDDGRFLSYTSKKCLTRIYSLPDCKLIHEIPDPAAGIRPTPEMHGIWEVGNAATDNLDLGFESVGFTPDRKGFAFWVYRKDGWSLELHNLATKTRRVVLDRQNTTGLVQFSSDGKVFARLPTPGIKVYSLQSKDFIQTTLGATAFTWELRDLSNGRLLVSIPGEKLNSGGFSADGKTLYLFSRGVLIP